MTTPEHQSDSPVQSKQPKQAFRIPRLVVAILVSGVVILVVLSLIPQYRPQSRRRRRMEDCAGHLMQIGFALSLYAEDSTGCLPPDLATLYRQGYLPDLYPFLCPVRRGADEIDQLRNAGEFVTDYVYFPQPHKSCFTDQAVVAMDQPDNHEHLKHRAHCLLFVDGGVQIFADQKWKQILAEAMDASAKQQEVVE